MIANFQPRVAGGAFEGSLAGDCDFEIGIGSGEEFGDREVRIGPRGEKEGGDVDAGEIASVVDSVDTFGAEPFVEMEGVEEAEFEVEVGAGPGDAGSGEAHDSDGGAAENALSDLDLGVGEVSVKAEKGAVSPVVFDDNVDAVVAAAAVFVDVNDVTRGDGTHFIEGVVLAVAFDGLDVDSFVELGGDGAFGFGVDQGADEAVLACRPWFGGFVVESPIDIHVKFFGFSLEEGLVVGGQRELEGGSRKELDGEEGEDGEERFH